MRRKGLTEGTRDEILAELDDRGHSQADGPHPNVAKARTIAQALHAIEAGAVEVEIRDELFRVVGEARPHRYQVAEEPATAIRTELEKWAEHWDAADPDRAAEYEAALAALGYGALAVYADGTLYRVVEG